MELVEGKKCTGCTACLNICPTNAITMVQNSQGFFTPKIDNKLCCECGQCNKVCPVLNKKNQETVQNTYAGWILNETKRMESSSGGIFTAIAEYVLYNKGYVSGVYMNDNNEAEHIIISNSKDLDKIRGSKYVQSRLNKLFQTIKRILDEGNMFLFSGTPCQISGLKNFLGKKYDNLFLVDIICHGVPSPKIFKDYIEQVEKETKKKISEIKFRDKSNGWADPQFILKSNDELLEKTSVYNDVYGRSFLTNMILRESCYNCQFSAIKSDADITLGDFWGVSKYKEELNDSKGTSFIITHTEKGNNLIKTLQDESIKLYENIPIEIAINNNYPIAIPSPKHVNSSIFFKEYENNTNNIKELLLKYLDDKRQGIIKDNSVGILNFHYENYNYGANLVAYSLMTIIEQLGYNASIINFNPFEEQEVIKKMLINNFQIFRNEFLKQTPLFSNKTELYKTNYLFDTFIVGSDQVWRKTITAGNLLRYFFDFVSPNKKILSYGASFGTNMWEGNEEETQNAQELLKRFDSISVRENDGINICKEVFNIEATRVLDPTILLSVEDYEHIINSENHDEEIPKNDYIAYYFLFDEERNDKNNNKLKEMAKENNWEIINIKGKEKQILEEEQLVYNSISSWLNYIKNSKIVITDSYHGVLFAILYNKPFICITKKCKSFSRFDTLFDMFDIKQNFFNDFEDIDDLRKILNINYAKINEKLEQEKKYSISFLKENLNNKEMKKNGIIEKEWIEEKLSKVQQNEKITKLEEQSQELTNQNIELNSIIAQKCKEENEFNTKVIQLEKAKKEINKKIEDLTNLNNSLLTQLEEQQTHGKALEEQLRQFTNSKSWKITAPLRYIAKKAKNKKE